MVGDEIIAIGSPHGFENNVSFGQVGSVDKTIYSHNGAPMYMFVDLSVFSGNSGGGKIILGQNDAEANGQAKREEIMTAIGAATGVDFTGQLKRVIFTTENGNPRVTSVAMFKPQANEEQRSFCFHITKPKGIHTLHLTAPWDQV